jgi:hypothetical protein
VTDRIETDIRFSIIPEWVIDSPISDRAIRIYGILARYADNETLQAFPSRELLAKRSQCSAKSVDRALEELIGVGAVVKHHRKSGNGYISNVYTLRRVGTQLSPGRDTAVPRVGTQLSPGRDTTVQLTRTTELEPSELEPQNDIRSFFEDFWNVYPRKVGKTQARKAFAQAAVRQDPQRIVEAAYALRDDPNLPPKQFIPHASTWLNRDGWDDEPYPEQRDSRTNAEKALDWVRFYEEQQKREQGEIDG